MTAIDRAQWIADARALIDFIEANPEVPLHLFRGLEISCHPLPNAAEDDQRMAAVDAVADMLGVTVTTPDMPGKHYEAEISFGSASYRAVAVLSDYRERYEAIQRLGEAALASAATS